VRQTLSFYPRYLILTASHLLLLAALAEAVRRGKLAPGVARAGLVGLSLLDLFGFGFGLNPAIAARDDRPASPVIAYLRREVGASGRVLGVGEELPPNTLMRYGLSDVRNYDSIELTRSLAWFAPLYEPGDAARTSRRTITWAGVLRARDRLRAASVRAVVGASPPPAGAFARVDRAGAAWIARLDGAPRIESDRPMTRMAYSLEQGEISIDFKSYTNNRIIIRETFDPGWRAGVDGRAAAVEAHLGTFLAVPVAAGAHRLTLRHDPGAVRLGRSVSLSALAAALALTGFRPPRSPRILVQGLGRTQAPGLKSVE
jgi:hypothetical protein